jgi:primosomal protein N' (replication factor Y)
LKEPTFFTEVAVDAPIRPGRTFTYVVPDHIKLLVGQMVQVPFGPRMADGIVFEISRTPRFTPARPIVHADSHEPLLSPIQLNLARWISQRYFSSLFSSASLMLPPQFRSRTHAFLRLPLTGPDLSVKDSLWEQTTTILARNQQSRVPRVAEEILRRLLGGGAESAIDRWVRRGLLERTWSFRQPKPVPISTDFIHEPEIGEPHLKPTPPQQRALEEIGQALSEAASSTFLLHGVTGSGKTEVYLQALEQCIRQGKRGICLVPEISLTPQTVRRFRARFPGKVALVHSGLSSRDHRQTWWDIRNGVYDLVVGPRSALFAPVDQLGLIIVDEEHEWTYKQQETEPHYHARAVAIYLARLTNSVVILGSATPDVITYHRSAAGRDVRLLELPDRVGSHTVSRPLAQVRVVDMRRELKDGNRSIFSRDLQEALPTVLARGEQVILFVNRRGTAGVVQCRDCGHVVCCRSCNTPFTYHSTPDLLLCHQCNRKAPVPKQCSNCLSFHVRYLGLGTQRVVQEVQELLPGVSVLRWDRDVSVKEEIKGTLLERFAKGDGQVLVGTQMVAKGLDISGVTLVGVVLADIGLHLPDFRAGERVFQLLCQVAGRAGRASSGMVILQTYRPDQYTVMAAAAQDYSSFYRKEIEFRRTHRLPPYTRLIHLTINHTNETRCQQEAQRISKALRHQREIWGLSGVDLIGPAPAYPARVRGRYRWHIILRGSEPRLLLDKVELPLSWTVDVDPVSVL